jgi:hypothetical protein
VIYCISRSFTAFQECLDVIRKIKCGELAGMSRPCLGLAQLRGVCELQIDQLVVEFTKNACLMAR